MYTSVNMKKIFSVLSLAALVVGVSLPVNSVHAASAGDLVKCEDYSAVYYLAEDGERYVFPNEQIYLSWYLDFHDVKTISYADLATIPLGDRIVYQAGTRLVKIPSDPSVFAVEDDGVLREIPDETTAIALFGEDWSMRVDDVSEAFWSSFTVGEPLAEDEIPEGTIVEDEDGDLFRVEDDGTATEIDAVLTTDQETVLEEHALSIDDIEERLGVTLALTRVDATAAIAVLEDLIARLRTVGIKDDEAVDVGDFDEVEDEDDTVEDAQDAIDDAIEEIAEAESDIAEDANDGKDVTASEALLVSAREHLALAQSALTAGDPASAEEHGDEARHDAMWARGKAVDSIDDEDDSEDAEEEDEVDDETDVEEDDVESDNTGDVEGNGDDTDDQNNDSSDDSDDSDNSESSGNDSSGSGSDDSDES